MLVLAAVAEDRDPLGQALAQQPARRLSALLARLAGGNKDRVLVRLMQGEGVSLAGELLRRFRKDQTRRQVRTEPNDEEAETRRMTGDLMVAWHHRSEERRRQAAERTAKEQARRAREQAAQAILTEVLTNRELQEQLQEAARPIPPPEESHGKPSMANRSSPCDGRAGQP